MHDASFRIVVTLSLLASWPLQVTAGDIAIPQTITFGNGAACDFNVGDLESMQSAINAAGGGDTIRVTNQATWTVPAGLVVANKSLTIVGGFSDCTDTTSDPDTPSIFNATGSATTLTVSNAIAGVHNVLVRNINLTGGDGGANKGGGVDLSGAMQLRLDNVNVQTSDADNGGGIYVHGGPPIPTLRLEGGSLIGATSIFAGKNNAFGNGGGIYCDNGGIIQWVDASINFNTANAGGGMYLDGCDLTMPSAPGNELRTVEMRGNEVIEEGGGLFARDSSDVSLTSELNRQVRISDNKADGTGGGVQLINSDFNAVGLKLEQNSAGNTGGGAFVLDSTFNMFRGDSTNCPDRDRCSTFTRNFATGAVGGIIAQSNSFVDLRQLFMESNTGASVAAVSVSSNSSLTLRDVQLAGNTGSDPGNTRLLSANDGTLDLRHVTAAFNNVEMVIRSTAGSSLAIFDSILWHPSNSIVDEDGSGTFDLGCNNASDLASMPGSLTHTPGFLYGDVATLPIPILHLAPTSENIDGCSEVPPPNPAFDVVRQPRVVAIPEVPDLGGTLDRGAVEYQALVFKHGFEN